MNINFRAHEVGPTHPRMRVWSDEMQGYGQFNIVDYKELQETKQYCDQLDVGIVFIGHYCNGVEECKCQPMKKNDIDLSKE